MTVGPTAAIAGNRVRPAEFDMATAAPGDVVVVTTTSGSHWYFTPTWQTRSTGSETVGMMVSTDSREFGQLTRAPWDMRMSRVIRLGASIQFGGGGRTGVVRTIRHNAAAVIG